MTQKVHGLRRSRTHLLSLSVSESQELSCGLAAWFWFGDGHEIVVKTLAMAAVVWNTAGAGRASSVLLPRVAAVWEPQVLTHGGSLFPTPCPLNTHPGATWVSSQLGVWFPPEQVFQENTAETAVYFRVLSRESRTFISTVSFRSAISSILSERRPHKKARPTGVHLGSWLPQVTRFSFSHCPGLSSVLGK